MSETVPKNYRISNEVGILMLAVAGLFDLFSAIPFANIPTTAVAWLCFWFWFKRNNVDIGFSNPRRALTMGGASLIEIIPAISVIPSWMLAVGALLFFARLEDKTGLSIGGIKKSANPETKTELRRFSKKLDRRMSNTKGKGRFAVAKRQREVVERLRKNKDVKYTDVIMPRKI